MIKAPWRLLATIALVTAIGCDDDDNGTDPTGSISVTASPTSLTVPQGGTGTVNVALVRGGGFSDPVNVAITGLPAGVTATAVPAQLTGTTTQVVVTVTVASTVAAGTYTATVTATAPGVGQATTTYSLTVTAATAGSFTISAAPNALTLAPGASGNSTVTIARTSFTNDVALTLASPPAGITGVFLPATLTGTVLTSSLTLTVGAAVAPGTYTVNVQGASGTVTRTAAITVTVPGTAADFTISAAPNALSLAPGGAGNSTVTIVRTNFTTDVALTLASPPAGITGVFTPATLTGTTLTSTLALAVGAAVAPGTYTVNVQGVGGTVTKTAAITVTVAAAANFTLTTAPTTLSLAPGASGNSVVTIARTNFTSDVALSLSSPPAGITGVFTPASLTGATLTSTLALTVGGAVNPGSYAVTVQGVGGTVTRTAVVNVTVTGGGGGGNIVWEFCNTDDLPLKFWRLSGGTWAEVAPTVVGTVTRFSFTIAAGSGGIAYTVSNTSQFSTGSSIAGLRSRSLATRVKAARAQSTTSALAARNMNAGLTDPYFDTFVLFAQSTEFGGQQQVCVPDPAPVSSTFTVGGMAAGETGFLGYGPAAAALTPTTPSYNLLTPPGTYDWQAVFGTMSGLPDFTFTGLGYRIGRNEATGGPSVAVARAGAPAFVQFPFTVSGGTGGAIWQFFQNLQGANGQVGGISIGSLLGGSNSGNMLFMQPGDRLGTDMNSLQMSNVELVGQTGANIRSKLQYIGSAPPVGTGNYALPAGVGAFVVSGAGGAPPTWSATGPVPSDYQAANSTVSVSFTGAGESAFYLITSTQAWRAANAQTASFTLTSPNLPGFLALWSPAAPLANTLVIMTGLNFTGTPIVGSFVNLSTRLQ